MVQTAFTSSYELADYRVVERLAGAALAGHQGRAARHMARSTSYHQVDIYLYEHMLAEAMAVVDGSFYSSDLEQVI